MSTGFIPTGSRSGKSMRCRGCPRFSPTGAGRVMRAKRGLISRLYQQIGQLKVELDWIKKSPVLPVEGQMQAYRAGPSGVFDFKTVRTLGSCPLKLVLRTPGGLGNRPGSDAPARRAVFAHPLLRDQAHDRRAASGGASVLIHVLSMIGSQS